MRFLVTAGPTREFIDAVRFISNASTGRMGLAVARRARRAGHETTLVLGPVSLETPPDIRAVRVVSAQEMLDAVNAEYDRCDVLVMTAAVCDYRPRAATNQKIKKGDWSITLELVRTPDILLEVMPRKERRIHVGFALEVQDPVRHAREKIASKRLDFIVLNSPAALAAESMDAAIIDPSGGMEKFDNIAKDELAARIVERVEQIYRSSMRGA